MGHTILVICYQLLKRKVVPYEELSEDYYVRNRRCCSSEAHTTKRLVRQLERLGHKVVLEPLVQSA